jgi:hypothetical protein
MSAIALLDLIVAEKDEIHVYAPRADGLKEDNPDLGMWRLSTLPYDIHNLILDLHTLQPDARNSPRVVGYKINSLKIHTPNALFDGSLL